jgi:hypothetical protein
MSSASFSELVPRPDVQKQRVSLRSLGIYYDFLICTFRGADVHSAIFPEPKSCVLGTLNDQEQEQKSIKDYLIRLKTNKLIKDRSADLRPDFRLGRALVQNSCSFYRTGQTAPDPPPSHCIQTAFVAYPLRMQSNGATHQPWRNPSL